MALIKYTRFFPFSHVGGPGTEIPFNQPFNAGLVPADFAGDTVVRTRVMAKYSLQLNDVGFAAHPSWPFRMQVLVGAAVTDLASVTPTDMRATSDVNRLLSDQMALEDVWQTQTGSPWGVQGWAAGWSLDTASDSKAQRQDHLMYHQGVVVTVQPQFVDSSDWFPFGTSGYAWTIQTLTQVIFATH